MGILGIPGYIRVYLGIYGYISVYQVYLGKYWDVWVYVDIYGFNAYVNMCVNCYISGYKRYQQMALYWKLFPNARPQQNLNDSNKFMLYFPCVIVGRGIRALDYRLKFRVLLSNVGPSYLLRNHIVKLSSAQLYRFEDAIELQVRWWFMMLSR